MYLPVVYQHCVNCVHIQSVIVSIVYMHVRDDRLYKMLSVAFSVSGFNNLIYFSHSSERKSAFCRMSQRFRELVAHLSLANVFLITYFLYHCIPHRFMMEI